MSRNYQKRQQEIRKRMAFEMSVGILKIIATEAKERDLTADQIISNMLECESFLKEVIDDMEKTND